MLYEDQTQIWPVKLCLIYEEDHDCTLQTYCKDFIVSRVLNQEITVIMKHKIRNVLILVEKNTAVILNK